MLVECWLYLLYSEVRYVLQHFNLGDRKEMQSPLCSSDIEIGLAYGCLKGTYFCAFKKKGSSN